MNDTLLPVTFTFVSILAISLIPLTGWIGVRRGKIDVLRGDGGDPILFKRIRTHGNLMENAPLFSIILGASEFAGLGVSWLWFAVATFLIGRGAHFQLYDSKLRGIAMLITVLPGVLMGFWLLVEIWA